MLPFLPEILVRAAEDFLEDFFVLRDEEVVFGFEVLEDVAREGGGQGEVGGAAVEGSAFDASRGDVEDPVRGAGFEQFDVDALDEYFQGGLGRAVHGEQRGGHPSGDADHYAAVEVAGAFEPGIEALDQAQCRQGVYGEGIGDVLLRNVTEVSQTAESGRNHHSVDIVEPVEEGVVVLRQVEGEGFHLGEAEFVFEGGLVYDIDFLGFRAGGELRRDGETDAVGAADDEHSFDHSSVTFCPRRNRSITPAMAMLSDPASL